MRTILFTICLTIFLSLFLATGATAQKSVEGEWDASMNTPGGAIPLKLVFKVDGEKLSGTAIRARGNVPLEGTVKGSDIAFHYAIDYNGNELTLSFTGKVSGDTIAGNVSFNGQADDDWSAKRAAPATKPKSDKP